ncbi:MAG: single-stranded-DNA-specific exonuclease RecJ [Verrucomicrobiota bacterium]|nr:single-stranded-DNA-specific exonuclease RecJ [Verrucomicrobiota bacterium]MEE2614790.1 single-stranded-DNA-specific exonuclease RecJ [Verrucomicrobiota bacterium]
MKYRWNLAPSQPLLTGQLIRELPLSPLLAQCLVNRGVVTKEEVSDFLKPKLKLLADPFLVPNMEVAIERLWKARSNNERLLIYGDYDADGITSTALLVEALTELGWDVQAYLPGRFDDGYGLSPISVEKCLGQFEINLLLAVDCGSTSNEAIDCLNNNNVDVIVLDHHQLSKPAPNPVAMVNPQLSNNYPNFQELCSVGLAFKLIHAIVKRGRQEGLQKERDLDLKQYLDLVAIGTVADLVPLVGENRKLLRFGLEQLSETSRPGLVALKKIVNIKPPVSVFNVGFNLGPRINAAGRMENPATALNLLLSKDICTAEKNAKILDAFNQDRQKIERDISTKAIENIKNKFDPEKDFVIVEGDMDWHLGVIGIVASRVMRKFYRPTFILAKDGDGWKGSARSIEGFDLAEAMRDCDDLLNDHGGHAMAAGVSVKPGKLDAFRERINEIAKQSISSEMFQAPLKLDAETNLSEMTLVRIQEMQQIEPTGQGNPEIQLLIPDLTMSGPVYRMGKEKQHVKFWVNDERESCEVIAWNLKPEDEPKGKFDLAIAPQVNSFNGHISVQLKFIDWRPTET